MQDNSDLIGRKFKSDDGVWTYEITGLDKESPFIVNWKNLDSNLEGCILAEFVRPHLMTE